LFYFEYWGKCSIPEKMLRADYHLLAFHCLDVAAVADVLLARQPRWWSSIAVQLALDRSTFRSLCLFFTALHDIGKFAAGFQHLQPAIHEQLGGVPASHKPYALRHDTIGHLFWRDSGVEAALTEVLAPDLLQRSRAERDLALDFFQTWSHATLGHHGVPPRVEAGRLGQVADLPRDRDAAIGFLRSAATLLQPCLDWRDVSVWLQAIPRLRKASWQLAGFAVLCDWLGSNERLFPFHSEPCDLTEYWESQALPSARVAVDQSGLIPVAARSAQQFENLFPSIAEPTPLQALTGELELGAGPRLFCLEDLTGAGKTEAAAMLAARLLSSGAATGIYFALPTMATANAMYERLAAFYRRLFEPSEQPSLVLAHGSRHLHDGYRASILPDPGLPEADYGDGLPTGGASCSRWLSQGAKKALLAQVGVGTIDQALLGVLPVRHQSLRLLGLADKVLIVDEVHACDEYMTTLLETLLTQVGRSGGSVILLSATLPRRLRQRLVTAFAEGVGFETPDLQSTLFPLLTHAGFGDSGEIELGTRFGHERDVEFELVSTVQAAETLAIELAAAGHCVCWVRNSVVDACESYEALRTRICRERIDIIHARFTIADRLTREQIVLDRFGPRSGPRDRCGRILVATQVVEQSLDLDFDHMISDLAPLDLLLQRAGRLRRHARDRDGERHTREARPGKSTLRVVSPVPGCEDGERWLSQVLPRTPSVYRQPGQLWRTAWLLHAEGRIRLPADSRRWMEAVFGDEDSISLPAGLQTADLVALGQSRADASLAALNVLDLSAGYAPAETVWEDDVEAMTRLGERQVTLRLARWIDGELHPWTDESPHPWAGGDIRLRIPSYGTPVVDNDQRQAIDCLPPAAHGRFDPDLVPMEMEADGTWRAVLNVETGQRRVLCYCEDLGAYLEPRRRG